ncbi:hypothetical protein GOP47_0026769 [Adiantum capillus-veneris]|nr:hypothetical protein GOP47_0026769 [Adiantum capillus-veneris]
MVPLHRRQVGEGRVARQPLQAQNVGRHAGARAQGVRWHGRVPSVGAGSRHRSAQRDARQRPRHGRVAWGARPHPRHERVSSVRDVCRRRRRAQDVGRHGGTRGDIHSMGGWRGTRGRTRGMRGCPRRRTCADDVDELKTSVGTAGRDATSTAWGGGVGRAAAPAA